MRTTGRDPRTGPRGFTLLELLVVIIILGTLAAVVVFATSGLTGQASASACAADARRIDEAQERHRLLQGGFGTAQDLVDQGYLRGISSMHDVVLVGDEYSLVPVGDCDGLVASGSGAPPGATATYRATASPLQAGGIVYADAPDPDMGTGPGALYFVFAPDAENGDETVFVTADATAVPGVPDEQGYATFHGVLGRLWQDGEAPRHFTAFMDERWFELVELFSGETLARSCAGFDRFFEIAWAEEDDMANIACDDFAPAILQPGEPGSPYTFAGVGAFLGGGVSVVPGFSPPGLGP